MTKIQIVLMAGVVCLGLVGSAVLGARLVYRLALLALMTLGLFAIAFPDATTVVAHALGVGRGTDLLLYVWILTGGFALLLLYGRIRRAEQRLTRLTRELALRDASPPEDQP